MEIGRDGDAGEGVGSELQWKIVKRVGEEDVA